MFLHENEYCRYLKRYGIHVINGSVHSTKHWGANSITPLDCSDKRFYTGYINSHALKSLTNDAATLHGIDKPVPKKANLLSVAYNTHYTVTRLVPST